MASADAQHDLPHEAVEGRSHEPTSAYGQPPKSPVEVMNIRSLDVMQWLIEQPGIRLEKEKKDRDK
jgi:hypothetical protein